MRACRSVEREERSTCLHPITTQTPTPNSHIPDNGPDCPLDLPGSQKWAASRARDGGEDSLDREDTEQIKVIATSDVIIINTSPSSLTASSQLLASPGDSGGQASCQPKRYRGWCPETKKCSSHASSCYLPLTLSYVDESHLHYSSITSRQLVGYDSSLMGSFNVMPSYKSYFTLTTTTKSLNTAVSYVGGAAISFISGPWTDWRGRREAIFWSAVITLVGGVIQGASQNIAMFIAGRLIVGFGMGLAQTSTPTLLAETVPVQYRGFAMGLYYACWGVGTLLASGVCYGTQTLSTTWSWRIPSLLQAAPSVWCFVILLFIPESPRWLIAKGRKEEALQILAIANGSGEDTEDTVVQLWAKEIEDTIQFERNREASAWKSVLHPSNRKRMLIVATFPLFVMLPGTNIVTFYFGDMLSSAGIEDANTQLQINVILTSFTLVVALAGSWFADKTGRKKLCAGSLTGGVISLYILAGLTAKYGTSGQKGGIYGTIAMIFIYNATYAWGITPLTVLYPPEVLSFDIRALGMGIYTLVTKLCGLFVAMVIPFGMEAISWKVYIINASVDILFVIFVVLVWVETRGLALEEVDKVFDGVKHSDVPDLETVKAGKYGDVEVTESASKAHRRETVI